MKLSRRVCIVAVTSVFTGLLLTPPHVVMAAGLDGAWHGTIQNYPIDPKPDRELFIEPDGTCKWDYAKVTKRRGPDTVRCTLDRAAGKIYLVTAGNSKVSLTLDSSDQLTGIIMVKMGTYENPYRITLKRGRAP
ncbi:MAG: hypothetical protein ACOY4R_00535 [Pseudomonadota bacterium]